MPFCRFSRPGKEVDPVKLPLTKILFWTPRVLGLLFAVFVSLFALDVFGEVYGFWRTMFALLMHLIPTGVLLVALAIAWRREVSGGLLFVALGAWYLISSWGRFHWSTYVVISGPLFLLGVLFIMDWFCRRRLRR
jgi:hypothetical protein